MLYSTYLVDRIDGGWLTFGTWGEVIAGKQEWSTKRKMKGGMNRGRPQFARRACCFPLPTSVIAPSAWSRGSGTGPCFGGAHCRNVQLSVLKSCGVDIPKYFLADRCPVLPRFSSVHDSSSQIMFLGVSCSRGFSKTQSDRSG